VLTLRWRGCGALDAVLDDPAEHDARRTIDDLAHLDHPRKGTWARCTDA
jgi:hypothetical protein